MNIKMNKVLSELKCVDKLYVASTGTDESLSLGACYYLNRKGNNKPFKNIYLGRQLYDGILTKNKIKIYFKDKKKYILKKKY